MSKSIDWVHMYSYDIISGETWPRSW